MNKLRISRRYNALYKVSIIANAPNRVWDECECHAGGMHLLFRTDYSARIIGNKLLQDMDSRVLSHDIYILNDLIVRCSEETAMEIVSAWLEQDLFVGEISVNKPLNAAEHSYMERVYRGGL